MGDFSSALFDEARAAWPGVELTRAEVERALARRVDPGEEPAAALSQVRAADLYLAAACARSDARALQLFDQRYLSRVPELIRRVDSSPDAAAEVAQELRHKLLLGGGIDGY